jgi:hypothetical protein
MAGRYRERQTAFSQSGTYAFFGGEPVWKHVTCYNPSETCSDTVGQRDQDNLFDLYQYWSSVPGLHGSQVVGSTTYREVVNWPIGYGNQPCDPREWYPVLTNEQLSNYAWGTISGTNPSKSSVNIPTFIGELKDVPSLVRSWGFGLLEKIASGNLWYQFGIRPMIADIKKLCRFTEETNKILRAFQKLRDEGSISRRCSLDSGEASEFLDYDGYLNTACNYYLTGQRYVTHGFRVWGSCRWKPEAGYVIPPPSPELTAQLKNIVAGFTLNGIVATTWELVPWSWLADWFLDVQGFLGALNAVPLEHGGICLMRTCYANSRYVVDTTPQTIYNTDCHIDGPYQESGVRKERYPKLVAGVPTVSIPALSWGQWSILGSLAVLKNKRRISL